MAGHEGVLQHDLVQLVRIPLLLLEQIHDPEAQRAALAHVQRGQHKGVHAVGEIALGLELAAVGQHHASGDEGHVDSEHAIPFRGGLPPVFEEQDAVAPIAAEDVVRRGVAGHVGVVAHLGILQREPVLDPFPGPKGQLEHRPALLHVVAQRVEEDAPIIHVADERAAQAVVQGRVVAHLLDAVTAHQQVVDQLLVLHGVPGHVVVPADQRLHHLGYVFVRGALGPDIDLRGLIHQIRAHVLHGGLDDGGHGPGLVLVRHRHVVPVVPPVDAFVVLEAQPLLPIGAAELVEEPVCPFAQLPGRFLFVGSLHCCFLSIRYRLVNPSFCSRGGAKGS